MSTAMLVEPAAFIFPNVPGVFDAAQFDAFWHVSQRLMRGVELNNLLVISTRELRKAVLEVFPYAVIGDARKAGRYTFEDAAAAIVRFLDRYLVLPEYQYVMAEEAIERLDGMVKQPPLYELGDIWQAWIDVLAQLCNVVAPLVTPSVILATGCQQSCVEYRRDRVSVKVVGKDALFLDVARLSSRWPIGFIDPELFEQICDRRGEGEVDFAYEDSGHQPSVPIKRALERAANDAHLVVDRMATTYFNPSLAESSKVVLGTGVADIGFRISDGKMTVKGVFHTSATTVEEQSCAMTYVQRFFKNRALAEGFLVD